MKDTKTSNTKTPSGIPLQASYISKNGEAPGNYPYTRGIHNSMYRSRLWTMRQYAGFGTAEESNKRYHYLLSQGITGLSVAFDLPTQMGYDSDHTMANGEVGRSGVAIDTIEDMEKLFQKINLSEVSTSMTINSTASILLCLYIAVAERQGADLKKLNGTVQNDILKEYIARGTYIYPPKASLKILTDLIAFTRDYVPKWNPISISGYHIREAGSTAFQEVAFTLANGFTYIEAALAANLPIDSFAPRLSFFFNAHNHLLEEVAKFRAARRIWAKELRETYRAKEERSMKLRFHAQTAGSMLTAKQVKNNIVRVSTQALAAVLGGAQSIHTNSYDEALALPTKESANIALRTQQILAYESGAADVADPLGGSYAVEELTNEIENKARVLLKEIKKRGGVIACIESGYIQKEVQDAAYNSQKSLEEKESLQVGTNVFVEEEEEAPQVFRMNLDLQNKQIESLNRFKANRDSKKLKKALEKLEEKAKSEENIISSILSAVKIGASLGEICDSLRTIYGEYQEKHGF